MRLLLPILLSIWICLPASAQPQTDPGADSSFVELKNGERLYGVVELDSRFLRSDQIVVNDSTHIELDSVRAFRSDEDFFARAEDGHLVKQEKRGRLTLYSRTEWHHTAAPMPMGPGPGPAFGASPSKVGYFAKSDGPIVPLDYRHLYDAVSDNPASLKYLHQYKTLGYVTGGLAAAGLGLMLIGATQLDPDGASRMPPIVYVGAGVAVSAWIPHLERSGKLDDAVNTYNE